MRPSVQRRIAARSAVRRRDFRRRLRNKMASSAAKTVGLLLLPPPLLLLLLLQQQNLQTVPNRGRVRVRAPKTLERSFFSAVFFATLRRSEPCFKSLSLSFYSISIRAAAVLYIYTRILSESAHCLMDGCDYFIPNIFQFGESEKQKNAAVCSSLILIYS